MRYLVLLVGILIPWTASLAAPVLKPKPINLVVCATVDGYLASRQRCRPGETLLTLSKLIPPTVPVANSIDATRCVTRQATAAGQGSLYTFSVCLVGEYLLTHGASVSDRAMYIIESRLLFGENEQYPGGVAYTTGDVFGGSGSHTLTVQAICCPLP